MQNGNDGNVRPDELHLGITAKLQCAIPRTGQLCWHSNQVIRLWRHYSRECVGGVRHKQWKLKTYCCQDWSFGQVPKTQFLIRIWQTMAVAGIFWSDNGQHNKTSALMWPAIQHWIALAFENIHLEVSWWWTILTCFRTGTQAIPTAAPGLRKVLRQWLATVPAVSFLSFAVAVQLGAAACK